MMPSVRVRVPATTANLGPGFDVLGLALDLWNEAEFNLCDDGLSIVNIQGEGTGVLPTDTSNAVLASARRICALAGKHPSGLQINCLNRIPLCSGMGSSAAAVLTGMLGANALLDYPFSNDEILRLATDIEGHPDNVAPALLGGLVTSFTEEGRVFARKLTPRENRESIHITLVLPEFNLPTLQSRAALPEQVAHSAAVFNISRAVLVCEALLSSDLDLLKMAMNDQLHQPYRMPLIPGALAAQEAAKKAGAAAVALSGAGPSLIAFSAHENPDIGEAMCHAFQAANVHARIFKLQPSDMGAQVSLV